MDLLETINLIDTKENIMPANIILANIRYIVFLFSASWCSPCIPILQTLRLIYQESIERDLYIQVIYISQDTVQDDMMKHFQEKHGPWYAVPFGDAAIDELTLRFGVTHIPYVAVLSKDGTVITSNGRKEIEDYGINVLTKWTK